MLLKLVKVASLQCNTEDPPARSIWHEIAKGMLADAFVIDELMRAVNIGAMIAC